MKKSTLPVLLASALCLFCASCSDDTPTPEPDPDPDPVPVTPTVAFASDYRVEGSSVTFTVLTRNAEKAAYLLSFREGDIPNAAEVLIEGVELTGKDTYTITEKYLAEGRGYIVYAAAVNGTTLSELAKLEFTAGDGNDNLLTLTEAGKNFISYHIEAEQNATYRHVALLKKVVENFTEGVQNNEEYAQRIQMLLSIYGMAGTGPVDFTLHDMDLRPTGMHYDVMAGMPYTVMACLTDAAGNYVGDCQLDEIITHDPLDNGLRVTAEIVDLQATELTVRYVPDPGLRYIIEQPLPKSESDRLMAQGGEHALLEELFVIAPRVTEYDELSEWAYLYPQTDYLLYVVGVDGQGDRTALTGIPFTTPEEEEIDVETENLSFDHVIMASYYGPSEDENGNASYNFYVLLATEAMNPDDYGDPFPAAFPCHAINCDFYTEAPAAGNPFILPDGTYVYAETRAAGTWSPDSWAAYFDEQEEMYELLPDEGTLTVERTGIDYHIAIDMKTDKGKVYTGTYTGPITFEDRSFSPFSVGKSRWMCEMPRWHAPMRR